MNNPMLRFLSTKNYKNLHLDNEIHLNNLNIFIGSNGSGKSNFISCLKFLKDCLTNIADENRGVSTFEDAVSNIGANKILDSNVESPAKVSFAYCFSQISQTNNPQKDSVILDFKIYTDKQKAKVSISEEYLYGGEELHNKIKNRQPFYYYKLHEIDISKGKISVYNSLEQTQTCFEFLENIPTNSLGLFTIPLLLENSQYPPGNTPTHRVRRELIDLISKWQFYNANNMNLNLIRTAEPKIGLRGFRWWW